ncbi:MAG: archaellin/type IV pilin N-terminal domain-containing protein [Candidatus Bathyarchaeia archaeon]
MNSKLRNFAKQKRAIVGLEAAIILIAFVIIAAVFSFMVINQGVFATERGKTVIQEGLKQASTPLAVDGTMFVKTSADGSNVTGLLIPLKAYGVKYVAMWKNTTVVTLKVGPNAWANVYEGVSAIDPTGSSFTEMLSNVTADTAMLFIQNSNGDETLDANEKGFLLINLGSAATVRDQINIEIRLEKTAPLSIEFNIPEAMPKDAWVNV